MPVFADKSEGFVEGAHFDILTICIWPLTKTKIGGTLCCSSPWPSKMNAWQVREMIQGGCRVETADFGETESFVVVGSLDPAISRSDVFTISERLGSVSLEMGLMCKESFRSTMLQDLWSIDIFFPTLPSCWWVLLSQRYPNSPIFSSETCDEVFLKVCGLPNWLWPVEAQHLDETPLMALQQVHIPPWGRKIMH